MVVLNEDLNPDAEPARISLSFKAHAGFDSPLINVSGGNAGEVKKKLAEVFGFEDVTELTAFEVLVNAHDLSRATYVAHEGLGATVDAKKQYGGGGNYPPRKAAPKTTGTPEAAAKADEPKAEANPHQEILDAIAGASDAKALVRIWSRSKTKNLSEHEGWPTAELKEACDARRAEFAAAKAAA